MASSLASGPESHSPSSSPRLPSPPPFPEVQIHSSTSGVQGSRTSQDAVETAKLDYAASRRIRPGTKAADMASGPPLVPLSELESPFQLQEHLKALYFQATKSERSNATVPINKETALMITTPPHGVDRSLWLYELCRFLVVKTNSLIVGFFSDTPPCSAQNCPEMRASEWQYLCAVHDPPKSCCAIDYCCHTLDWAANVLTSQKHFPSRLTLGSESAGGSQQGVRQLTNIFRRVYRMFAHAWFQHRDVFWTVENHEGLYVFYKTVCDYYQLIPEDNYTVPREAEGYAAESEVTGFREDRIDIQHEKAPQPRSSTAFEPRPEGPTHIDDEHVTATVSTGATTRRHKHTPSISSVVTTIAEGDEDGYESSVKSEFTSPQAETPQSILEHPFDTSTAATSLAESEAKKPEYGASNTLAEQIRNMPIDDPETDKTKDSVSNKENVEALNTTAVKPEIGTVTGVAGIEAKDEAKHIRVTDPEGSTSPLNAVYAPASTKTQEPL